jgi:FkbH-like protein
MTTELSRSESALDFLLVSNFNLSNLAALISNDEELPIIRAATAPVGQVMQVLLDPRNEHWTKTTHGVVIWTSPESVSPSYKRLLENEETDSEDLLSEVDEFCNSIKAIPAHVKCIFVPSWIVGPLEKRMGLLDMDLRHGLSPALMRMNLRLLEGLRSDSRMFVLDAARWVGVHGEKTFSQRLWYMSKTPFGSEFLKTAAAEIKAAVRALSGTTSKLLLLDLDDTLWGGLVGDLGWQNLRLGGIDPIGEAFRDFQLALKALKRRGVLLGVISKNEESTALEAIRSHPEMVLREDDVAGWRINWQDKAQNIADLTAELNLGLQSVVFIDDNPVERARVRDALPEVLVPDWPENPMEYKSALSRLRCFDVPVISGEDRSRTAMHVSERKRREGRAQVASLEQWLDSLDIRVLAESLSEATLDRATQLLNKTNQMNLSTRRMTKQELWNWSQQPGNTVLTFRVLDKFGNYGLVGVGSLSLSNGSSKDAQLVDFLLSCRIMGRKVEEAMLHVVSDYARSAGATGLHIAYIPTLKNQPCLRFFESAGLHSNGDDKAFTLDLQKAYPKPATTHLVLIDCSKDMHSK